MNNLTEAVVTILVAVIGLATLAVFVSRNARTSEIIRTSGDAFSSILGVAVSPVSGNSGISTITGRVY